MVLPSLESSHFSLPWDPEFQSLWISVRICSLQLETSSKNGNGVEMQKPPGLQTFLQLRSEVSGIRKKTSFRTHYSAYCTTLELSEQNRICFFLYLEGDQSHLHTGWCHVWIMGLCSFHGEAWEDKTDIAYFKLPGSCPCTSHWPKAVHINTVIQGQEGGNQCFLNHT